MGVLAAPGGRLPAAGSVTPDPAATGRDLTSSTSKTIRVNPRPPCSSGTDQASPARSGEDQGPSSDALRP